jgi:transcriptional regulator with XRE-family HTH domain
VTSHTVYRIDPDVIADRTRALGISQSELARRAGVDRAKLNRIVNGQPISLMLETAMRLAAALDIDVYALCGLESPPRLIIIDGVVYRPRSDG